MIETATDPGFLAALLAGLACFATILTIAAPALKGNNLDTRLKSVSNRREELRRKSREQLSQKGLRRTDEGVMKRIVDKLDLQSALKDDNLEKALVQAGLRGPRPVSAFYFARFALPFALGLFAFLYLHFVNDFDLNTQLQICAVMFAAAAGFYAPNMYLTNRADKRKASIMKAFPDSLDMMLICVEAGMSIELAFARVGEEIGTASVELAEELGLTTAELSYLQERRQAYLNLAERTNHPGIKSVATALVQAEKYGTPMGTALRAMAKENREIRILEAEKKAAALPAKLTVPMIVFFLPVLFLVIGGPAYIQIKGQEGEKGTEVSPMSQAVE
ncbi:type II secretion system F family protein [Hirschia litorea]|uniref:Type II secretion system F family protein n=1 Tax=Hirschia litorea TaxID=1199156 RepID=A0ABW2IK29_9PROT